MFMKDITLSRLFFLGMSLSGFDIEATLVTKNELGSILSKFMKEFVQNWRHFLLKSLAEFTNEALWAWSFLCWKF